MRPVDYRFGWINSQSDSLIETAFRGFRLSLQRLGSDAAQAVVLGRERKLETCFKINGGGGEVDPDEKNQSKIAAVATAAQEVMFLNAWLIQHVWKPY